ncbi:MAG: GNAT family N-acetyltransferase, partial [Oscillospiraceae bacterium]|nr:GNAT family N-acetyltransferase [Oscillospiraceae bacterium]
RKGQETPVFPQDGVGECTDPEASYEILCNCFSTLTGCVPSREEWDELCSRGQVLSLFGGLLHYETKGKITELRHLAVAEDCRRQGLGRYLVGAYLNRCGSSLSRVWTGEENLPARKLYDSLGYASDGWHSVVLYYDTNQKEE